MAISLNASSTTGLIVTPDNSGIFAFQKDGTEYARISATGNVGIGTQTPAYPLDVVGNINVSGTVAMASSFKRNRIINGNMVVDQRNAGAQITAANLTNDSYMVDRWKYQSSQAAKFTAQQNAGSVTTATGFPNYLGMTVATAVTVGASDYFLIGQPIEGFNFADLAWGTANAKTITLSFQVYSSLTGTFGGSLINSSVTRSYPFSYTVLSANTWTSISVTIAGDTTGTWVGSTNGVGVSVRFGLGVGSTYSGTAGAWAAGNIISSTGAVSIVGTSGATFYITGVQLEVGTKATPYEFVTYSDQLAQCQRYYTTYTVSFRGYCLNGDYVSNPIYYSTQMRIAPAPARSGGTFISCSFAAAENINVGMCRYTLQASSSTMVQVINDVATFSAEF
jgi:hypothetical protein